MCAKPVTPGGGQYALSDMTETGTETDVKAGILTVFTREREAKVVGNKVVSLIGRSTPKPNTGDTIINDADGISDIENVEDS